jgi:hypothetical protein
MLQRSVLPSIGGGARRKREQTLIGTQIQM